MQKLHLVGVTTDQEGLILSTRRGARTGSYSLAVDDVLIEAVQAQVAHRDAAAAAEDEERRAAAAARPDSRLGVREVQAQLRQGRSVEEVAEAAGVDPSWVERFAAPVRAELAQVAARVREMTLDRSRLGESAVPIGAAVVQNLGQRGLVLSPAEVDAAWSAAQLAEGRWAVRFAYHYRARDRVLQFDLDEVTATVEASDRTSGELGYVAPTAKRPAQQRRVPPRSSTSKAAGASVAPLSAMAGSERKPTQPAQKPKSRPSKERQRAAQAMTKAAAQRAREAERAAARRAREREAAEKKAARERESAEKKAEREQAAKERASAAAAAAKQRAAEKAKAEKVKAAKAKAAEKAKAAAQAKAERAKVAEKAKAEKAKAEKAKAEKAKADKARPTKAERAKAAEKARAEKASAEQKARAERAKAAKAPAETASAVKAAPKAKAASSDKVARKAQAEQARAAKVKKAPAKAMPSAASKPAPDRAESRSASRPVPRPAAVRVPRPAPRPQEQRPPDRAGDSRLSGAAVDVYGPSSARALFRAGLVEQAGDGASSRPAPPAQDGPSTNGSKPEVTPPQRPRRTRPLRATD